MKKKDIIRTLCLFCKIFFQSELIKNDCVSLAITTMLFIITVLVDVKEVD